MKHLTITLLTLLMLGGCDNSQKASKPTEEPYLFSFEENTYFLWETYLRRMDYGNRDPEFPDPSSN